MRIYQRGALTLTGPSRMVPRPQATSASKFGRKIMIPPRTRAPISYKILEKLVQQNRYGFTNQIEELIL